MSPMISERLTGILTELKVGSMLTIRKRNGEKYSRYFLLDQYEDFISYRRSEIVTDKLCRCKLCNILLFEK